MSRRRRGRGGEGGQSLIETAVVIGVLFFLLTGVYAVATFASDQSTATSAVRSGARLAAEQGNGGGAGTDPTAIDRPVVQTVCQAAANMPYVVAVDEVDIYLPDTGDGSWSSTARQDQYTCADVLRNGTPGYTLDLRTQLHPNEASIGVRVVYRYRSPTPVYSLQLTASRYAVMLMEPRFS